MRPCLSDLQLLLETSLIIQSRSCNSDILEQTSEHLFSRLPNYSSLLCCPISPIHTLNLVFSTVIADNLIKTIEAKKQNIISAVENETRKTP